MRLSRFKTPLVIVVDYDGILDRAGYPNTGKIDEFVAACLGDLQAKGAYLVLNTCRTGGILMLPFGCVVAQVGVRCCEREPPTWLIGGEIVENSVGISTLTIKTFASVGFAYIGGCGLSGCIHVNVGRREQIPESFLSL